jgi:hypothetical protein
MTMVLVVSPVRVDGPLCFPAPLPISVAHRRLDSFSHRRAVKAVCT